MANSTPMVDLESRLNSLRVKRLKRLDLPTPESPMSTTVCSYVSKIYLGEWEGLFAPLNKNYKATVVSSRSGYPVGCLSSHIIFLVCHSCGGREVG